jgi:hypothetical protein
MGKKKKGRKIKRYLASMVMLLMVASPAMAFDTSCDGPLGGILNSCVPQVVDTDTDTDTYAEREQFSYGAGLDLVLLDTDMWWMDEVTAEGRYNVETDDYSVFGVLKVNVAKLLGGK